MGKTFSIKVTENSQVGEARRVAIRLAMELKFSEVEAEKIAIIVTEAATNLVKHSSQGGEIVVLNAEEDVQPSIHIFAIDKGPGIANLELCVNDGYSTADTSGTGLGAMKRLANNFNIASELNVGTVVWANVKAAARPTMFQSVSPLPSPIEAVAICSPMEGE